MGFPTNNAIMLNDSHSFRQKTEAIRQIGQHSGFNYFAVLPDHHSGTRKRDAGSNESLLSDFSSDEETERSDDLTQVRNFCELDIRNLSLSPPRFPLIANPEVLLNIDLVNGALQFRDIFFDDNLLELIVSETNRYADRIILNSNPRMKSRARKRESLFKDKKFKFFSL
ncbi:uncharacterized protein TNCV_3644041 [Trichonephila clavipes]|nr:uncharacterized protein TNCV_3644041 [Trichonephila clavipes]